VSGPTVAIDGPAGAGKSTVAQAVAVRLGLPHLDTGAMYRAVALAVLRRSVDPTAEDEVVEVADKAEVEFADDGRVLVDGEDVTAEIRGAAVTATVSAVARHPGVRLRMREAQRDWAQAQAGGVVEGRDIGAVVLPDADLKIWLTASPRVRAERRMAELGGDQTVDDVAADIERRDRADAEQSRPADDAVVVDTSGLSVEEVVDRIVAALGRGDR
jgi:CMP/dCMP kinase